MLRVGILTATSLVALAAPAMAQTAAPPPTPAAPAAGLALQEVVVTAQRRSENIQKVPVAVAAFTSTQLAAQNITTGLQLNKVVPSLSLTSYNGSVLPFLRGVGSTFTPPGNESSVAIYIDGVYYARVAPVILQLNNVQNIEVLKGPQGTLFGRNSTGGLVQVITKSPTPGQTPELDGSIGYGNFNTINADLYAAVALNSKMAIDFSGVIHDQQDGWGRDTVTGGQHLRENSRALRSKFVYEVTPKTKIQLSAEYERASSDIGVPANGFSYSGTQIGTLNPTPGQQVQPYGNLYDSHGDTTPSNVIHGYTVTGRITQDLGFATLSDIVAYQYQRQTEVIDLDNTPQPFLSANLPSRDRQFTEELQLQGSITHRLHYTAGFFYINLNQGFIPAQFYGSLIGSVFGAPTASSYDVSNSSTHAEALYAQATYEILSNLHFTLGGRASHDHILGSGYQEIQPPGSSPIVEPGTTGSSSRSVQKPSYRVALDYQVVPSVLTYVSVSEGFKEPVYNMVPFSPTPTKAEVLTAYEVGAKSDLFDRRLRLNGAAFFYEIDNPQVQTSPVPGSAVTSNGQHAQIKGLEGEAQFAVTSHFRLRAAATYLHARYTRFQNASFINPDPEFPFGNFSAVPGDATGHHMPFAPSLSGNIGFDYTVPFNSGGDVTLTSNLFYTNKIYFEPDNRLQQPSYALLDASVTYNFPNKVVYIRAFGSNLADKFYYTSASAVGEFFGDVASPGAPRTFGVTVGFRYK